MVVVVFKVVACGGGGGGGGGGDGDTPAPDSEPLAVDDIEVMMLGS